MTVWRLLQRFLRSDLRAGEVRNLMVAVAIAVAAVTAVNVFTQRVDQALARQGTQLLAADLVVRDGDPIPAGLATAAAARGLASARTLSFRSVVFANEEPVLVEVKAVDDAYPLRGMLRLQAQAGGDDAAEPARPGPGEVWVEPDLLPRLGVALGDTLPLGEAQLTIAAVIEHEPDRSGELARLAPRVLMALDGVAATGLLGPASRVTHRLLVAGPEAAVKDYRRWLEIHRPPGSDVDTLGNGQPALQAALQRGGQFLSLAALCAVLLAAAAIALSSRLFVQRQLDAAALLRCLGTDSRRILQLFALRLLALASAAALAGALAGYLLQFPLVWLIGDWFDAELPAANLMPLWRGLVVGLTLMLGFALPAILRFREVPPLRVLRHDLAPPSPRQWLVWGAAALCLLAVVVWQVGEPVLAAQVLLGVAALAVVIGLAAWVLLALTARLRNAGGSAWRYGVTALARRPGLTTLQLGGFALGLLVLLLLALVRVDLLTTWRASLPPQTPDHFVLNVQPDERPEFTALLARTETPHSGVYPMIRGRLMAIGEQATSPEDYDSLRARRLAAREFNLSSATEMQRDNRVIAGRWWDADELDQPWLSVEEGLADTLGVSLGDSLTFEVAGQRVTGTVSSLRTVRWDSFNVNFFVVGTPGLFADLPATYITSFYRGDRDDALMRSLAADFPSVSVIDIRPIMERVRSIMDQGIRAVEAVFLFTLAAGVVVLFAAVQLSQAERAREVAVLRTLGASRRLVQGAILVEFALLGVLAGALAAAAAHLVGFGLAREVFSLPWQPNPVLGLTGVGAGMLGVALAGWVATRTLLRTAPIEILRRGVD